MYEIQKQKQQKHGLKPSENNLDSQDLSGQIPKDRYVLKLAGQGVC